ncbi:MAG: hypothetical protein N2376_06215 [Clostridia bacterium]|nr:hypothetical protein [Clostridia bacterium]
MKSRALTIILALSVVLTVIAGCGVTTNPGSPSPSASGASPSATADVKTSASIVDNPEAFMKAISNNGTWIIAIVKDLTINKDLVLDGEYKNGKKDKDGKDIIQRKIALYAQDANRKITARYTLTAPKFTINSPKASIQHGTFKGDVYVNTTDFALIDATVDGNIYFANADAQKGFTMDATSKVTGKQEVKAP